jgi:hypothetical protein
LVDVLPLRADAGQALQEDGAQLAQLAPLLLADAEGASDLRHPGVGGLPRHIVHLRE